VRGRGGILLVTMGLLVGGWLLGATPAAGHALVVGTNPQAATRIARAPTASDRTPLGLIGTSPQNTWLASMDVTGTGEALLSVVC
jgi:hypothetical protein